MLGAVKHKCLVHLALIRLTFIVARPYKNARSVRLESGIFKNSFHKFPNEENAGVVLYPVDDSLWSMKEKEEICWVMRINGFDFENLC